MQAVETLVMLDCRADACLGGPGLFPVKIRDLPEVCYSFQLVQPGFPCMKMENQGRGQVLDTIGLASLYRVG